jgi:hypothetical protein
LIKLVRIENFYMLRENGSSGFREDLPLLALIA